MAAGGKAGSGGARTVGSGAGAGKSSLRLPNGDTACRFFQGNACNFQLAAQCKRGLVHHKHVCIAVKKDGSVCGARHSKDDHK